jgi:hypothetical protein
MKWISLATNCEKTHFENDQEAWRLLGERAEG